MLLPSPHVPAAKGYPIEKLPDGRYACVDFSGYKGAPYFCNGLYSYGALLGFLSNYTHYLSSDLKLTGQSGRAEYDKHNREWFGGEFADMYELHSKLLWHGSGKITVNRDLDSFAKRYDIEFFDRKDHTNYPDPFSSNAQNVPSAKSRSYVISCNYYIEDLLLKWNFLANKIYNRSAVTIFPPTYSDADKALKGISDPKTAISCAPPSVGYCGGLYGSCSSDEGFGQGVIPKASETDNRLPSGEEGFDPDRFTSESEFVRGFRDGFNYNFIFR